MEAACAAGAGSVEASGRQCGQEGDNRVASVSEDGRGQWGK